MEEALLSHLFRVAAVQHIPLFFLLHIFQLYAEDNHVLL